MIKNEKYKLNTLGTLREYLEGIKKGVHSHFHAG